MRITSRKHYGCRRLQAYARSHNPLNCIKPCLVNSVSNRITLPNILLLNSRSIAGKIDELICISSEVEHQIICVTETWLDETVPNEYVSLPKYDIIRADRSGRRGGGVAIYVHETLPYRTRYDLSSEDVECVWIVCQPKQLPRSISRLVVACIYLPPNLSHDKIEQAYDYLLHGYDKLITESPDSAFVITGDFNPKGNGFEPKTLSIHCKLKQIVRSSTRNEATLDLIFTNIQDFYSEPSISAPLGTSDHACVKLQSLNEVYVGNLKRKVKVRPIKDSSLNLIQKLVVKF